MNRTSNFKTRNRIKLPNETQTYLVDLFISKQEKKSMLFSSWAFFFFRNMKSKYLLYYENITDPLRGGYHLVPAI